MHCSCGHHSPFIGPRQSFLQMPFLPSMVTLFTSYLLFETHLNMVVLLSLLWKDCRFTRGMDHRGIPAAESKFVNILSKNLFQNLVLSEF